MRYFFGLLSFIGSVLLNMGCGDTVEQITNVTNVTDSDYELVITDYGAKGDGKSDCSDVINMLIQDLPASGGVIVIPQGDFLLNKPIVVDRNYVTIKGVNPGLRSNIDVSLSGLVGPGGGSKLLIGSASSAILIPDLTNVDGRVNRISGVQISDILISGGTTQKGIGINILHDNDGFRITNVVGINLNYGISAYSADAMIIQDCWLSEVKNSILMTDGIQNMIKNCQLGAVPTGITCKLVNQENFIFTGNHVYPDGDKNLVLENCTYTNISNNNFQSYYINMLELGGSYNLVDANIFWLRSSTNQLKGKDENTGIVIVKGDHNMVTDCTIKADWISSVVNPVSVRSFSGVGNSFSDIKITNQLGNRLFYVNDYSSIVNCVPVDKVFVDGDSNNVTIKF